MPTTRANISDFVDAGLGELRSPDCASSINARYDINVTGGRNIDFDTASSDYARERANSSTHNDKYV